jgi:hypothetical protein
MIKNCLIESGPPCSITTQTIAEERTKWTSNAMNSWFSSGRVSLVVAPTDYANASQQPGRGPVVGPGINYTGPREALLEFVISIF